MSYHVASFIHSQRSDGYFFKKNEVVSASSKQENTSKYQATFFCRSSQAV
jgi:hypothetical protein